VLNPPLVDGVGAVFVSHPAAGIEPGGNSSRTRAPGADWPFGTPILEVVLGFVAAAGCGAALGLAVAFGFGFAAVFGFALAFTAVAPPAVAGRLLLRRVGRVFGRLVRTSRSEVDMPSWLHADVARCVAGRATLRLKLVVARAGAWREPGSAPSRDHWTSLRMQAS